MTNNHLKSSKMFIDVPMFVVTTNGYVLEAFGEPVKLAMKGLLVFSKVSDGEKLFEIYMPDEINYYQLDTFEKNTASVNTLDWKYKIYKKMGGSYSPILDEGRDILPNLDIMGIMYNQILDNEFRNGRKRK